MKKSAKCGVVDLRVIGELVFDASYEDAKRNVTEYLDHIGIGWWFAYDHEGEASSVVWDEGRVCLWSHRVDNLDSEDELYFTVVG